MGRIFSQSPWLGGGADLQAGGGASGPRIATGGTWFVPLPLDVGQHIGPVQGDPPGRFRFYVSGVANPNNFVYTLYLFDALAGTQEILDTASPRNVPLTVWSPYLANTQGRVLRLGQSMVLQYANGVSNRLDLGLLQGEILDA